MREITYAEAINEALTQAMQLSEDVIVLGQLVDYKPGIFGTTKGLADRFGTDRVRDFPNAECVMTSVAIGSSLVGKRPVIVHPRLDFMMYSFDPIVNWLSLWHFKSNKQSNAPITIRVIIGKGWGQGPQHSKGMHAWFSHLPGIRAAVPATPADVKGLLLESIFGEVPSVILENRALFSMSEHVPTDPYRIRFGKAAVRREGEDLTLAAIGIGVPAALQAASALEKEGISVEIIDMRTVSPIDYETVVTSVEKTRRLAVVDYAWPQAGVAADIVANVWEQANCSVRSKPLRITLPFGHTPMSRTLENEYYPDASSIARAIREMF
jgi:acetoin:2,6-dichlorophenolindophenol oxidoreductase subunit beta